MFSALPSTPTQSVGISAAKDVQQQIAETYQEITYHSSVAAYGDPENGCVLARLMGVTAADPRQARILELGCGTGTNLLNIALRFPQAQCVGIDLTPSQVDLAQDTARQLGVTNARFRAANILELSEDLGIFDYIIAHGVYSWVPREVQDQILAICRRHMSPQGMAMISYNVKPGWALRGLIRDLMLYQASSFEEPQRKIQEARGALQFLAGLDWGTDPYGQFLQREAKALNHTADHYIYHEFLELHNEPLYFHQFHQRLQQAGLQYLGDAVYGDMLLELLPLKAQEVLRQVDDRVRLEQYIDFVRYRQFRHSWIVQQEVPIQTKFSANKLAGMWLAGSLAAKPTWWDATPALYKNPSNPMELTVTHPLHKVVFQILSENWPNFLPYEELHAAALQKCTDRNMVVEEEALNKLGDTLLKGVLFDFCQIQVGPPCWNTVLPNKPKVYALARWYLDKGEKIVPSLMHRMHALSEAQRLLLALCDGVRTVDEVRTSFVDLMIARSAVDPNWPKKRRQEWLEATSEALEQFMKLGVFEVEGSE